jgi:hypothetical protein
MSGRTVDFCYDILSPFAHVALKRLVELPADVTVRPVPVLLGAILTPLGSARAGGDFRQAAPHLSAVCVSWPKARSSTSASRRGTLSIRLKALRLLAGFKTRIWQEYRQHLILCLSKGRSPDSEE